MKDYIKKTIFFSIYKKYRFLYDKYESFMFSTRFILSASYHMACLRNSIENIVFYRHQKKISTNIDWKNINSVLFLHSKMHFYPPEDNPGRLYYYSGITNVARHIWKICEGKECFYMDVKARELGPIPKVDMIIGLMSENFRLCAKANPRAKKILLLVNCHPLYRAKVLLSESRKLSKHIPPSEWLRPNLFFRVRKYADFIVLPGSQFTKNTFLDYGVKEIPIKLFDAGINTDVLFSAPETRPKDKVRFIYPASHMGLRKGFFRMLEAWRKLNSIISSEKIELYLVGGNEISFVRELTFFIKEHPNVYNLGWVSDADQVSYFKSSHAVVAPAIEEGQVSAVLEAMACGAIPIITEQCGIDLKHGIEGFMIKDYGDASEIAEYMRRIIEDEFVRKEMSLATITHILKYHTWKSFEENFKRIIM